MHPGMEVTQERRWAQVKGMFLSLYSKRDLYDFYGYGCYCLSLGDRPMSGNTFGRTPVDAKDTHCYNWQQCAKCAKVDHGSDCLSELTNYNVSTNFWPRPFSGKCRLLPMSPFLGTYEFFWRFHIDDPVVWNCLFQYEVVNGQISCLNAGGCKRAICECDKNFVAMAQSAIDAHNPANSVFGRPDGFDWDANCSPPPPTSGGGAPTPQCCGDPGVRFPYNPTSLECCSDGRTESIGMC